MGVPKGYLGYLGATKRLPKLPKVLFNVALGLFKLLGGY
jgi:hypothetical protein